MKCICLFAAIVSGALAQTAVKPPEGSIEGQIFNAGTGTPLKKATVHLTGTQPQNGSQSNVVGPNGGRGTPPRQFTRETDEQGRFQFTNLDPLRYTVSATRTGFLQQSYGAKRAGWGGGTPIFLTQNQHVKDIVIRMTPQGVITGRVLDEDGDPLPNVNVKVMRLRYISGKKQWSQSGNAQTSDIGEYRIPELQPGKYLVGTQARPPMPAADVPPDKPETIYAATYYPRGLDENSAAPIDVGPGGEMRGIDIHMVKVPAVRVRGTIANATDGGRGRGGVQVGLSPRDGGAANGMRGALRMSDNSFEIRGVQPGSYLLWAKSGAAGSEMFTSQPLDVGATPVNSLVLTLAPAMEIPVQITVAERDAQVDLKTVMVRMRSVMPVSMAGAAPMARMEDGGRFTLRGVTPLRYVVSIDGLPDGCYVQSMRYGGQEVASAGTEFTVRAPLEVVISASAGKIAGTVTDKDGRPMIGAIVVLLPPDAAVQPQEASSDDNGAFTFNRLKPGRYKVLAWEDMEPGAYQDPEFRKLYESRAAEVNVGPRDQQTAQLRAIMVEEMAGK